MLGDLVGVLESLRSPRLFCCTLVERLTARAVQRLDRFGHRLAPWARRRRATAHARASNHSDVLSRLERVDVSWL